MRDEHAEPAVVMCAHMAANALKELRLASRAVFLGRRVAMEVDIVHNQARATGALLEVLELW